MKREAKQVATNAGECEMTEDLFLNLFWWEIRWSERGAGEQIWLDCKIFSNFV